MTESLRILILEDNPADAELVQFELEEAGISFAAKVVKTEKDFIHEIQAYCPHLILSDYDLPKYNGALALAEARRRCPDTPFILVTGAVTEDRAIEILTQGAKDYVLKSRLEQRLVPAVRRALAEAKEHEERKKAEEELQAASLYARTLIEASLDPLVTISSEGKVMDVNKATEEITGVSRERIIGNDFSDFFTEPEKARAGYKKVFSEGSVKDYPLAIRHVTGRVTEVLYNATTYKNEKGEVQGVFAAARDITELKKAEEELHEAHRTLEKQVAERTSELQESRERLSLALTSSGMGTFEWDIAKNRRHFDDYVHLLFGINPETFSGTAEEFFQVIHPDDRKAVQDALDKATEKDKPYETEYRAVWPDGSVHHITARGKVLRDSAGRPLRMIGVCWEITERKQAEMELKERTGQLEDANRELEASRRFLEIANKYKGLNQLLEEFVAEMQKFTGCEAVGIRLLDERGNIPYLAYRGFSRQFYETESPLSIKTDKCMCINVVKGTTDPALPFYTEGGSFYMNGTTRFLATVSEEDKGQTRNVCNQTGYESVALIPIRVGTRILGLIHLADRRENMVPLDAVRVLEQVAAALGVGAQRAFTEAELRQQREWLQVTLSSIGDAVIATDAAGKVSFMNTVAEALTGWSFPEASAKDVTEVFNIINEDTRQAVESPVTRVLAEGMVVGLANHTILVRRDGTEVPIDDSGAPIRNADGKTLGVGLIFRDITERKQAEDALRESENRLRRLYESGLLGVIYWNMNGEITDANDKFLEMVGYGRDDLSAGRIDWGRMTPPEYRHLDERSVAELKATGVNKEPFEKEYIRKDGARIPVIAAGAMLDEAHFNGVAFALDITERKRMEKALKARSDQLEAANRELESFSYTVSHDLKAPLRAIEGYSRRLTEKYKGTLDGGAARMIEVIRGETEQMGRLIDDLLSYSKVLSNGMTLSEIDMDKLAGEVWNDIRASDRDRKLDVKIPKLLPGFGDRALIRHVLFNLLANAVKFTKNKAPGIIEMGSYAEPGSVVYCVKDHGVGFDMAYYDKLFGLFHRLHDREEYAGTGVGLAIVRRIINRHGGRVWAEGKVDDGATFYFSLPMNIGSHR